MCRKQFVIFFLLIFSSLRLLAQNAIDSTCITGSWQRGFIWNTSGLLIGFTSDSPNDYKINPSFSFDSTHYKSSKNTFEENGTWLMSTNKLELISQDGQTKRYRIISLSDTELILESSDTLEIHYNRVGD